MRCHDFKSWLPERSERLARSELSERSELSGRSARSELSERLERSGPLAAKRGWRGVAQQVEMFAFAEVVEQEGGPFRWRDCGCDYGLETLVSQYVSGC